MKIRMHRFWKPVLIVSALAVMLTSSVPMSATTASAETGRSTAHAQVQSTSGVLMYPSADTYYKHIGTDNFNFTSSGREVHVYGSLNWYVGMDRINNFPDRSTYIFRGDFANAYAVLKRNGCAHIRVTWGYPTGSVSMPPGGSVTGGSAQGDTFVGCGRSGQWLSFSSMGYAKRFLTSATVEVWYSQTANGNRGSWASHKMRS